MLSETLKHDLIKAKEIRLIKFMQSRAERVLNPCKYHLSEDAKKRLRWLYVLYYEKDKNISLTANNLGISRQWLSSIKKVFEYNNRNPRSLEPQSRAPNNTNNRNRIEKYKEALIIKIRTGDFWGKDKIAAHMLTEYKININPNTVNKYLHKHELICPKISLKNTKAMAGKKDREREANLESKYRSPSAIKDFKPGALIEKDMKYIAKPNRNKLRKTRDGYWYQQTMIDTFTRYRTMELTPDFESKTAVLAYQVAIKRFPFDIACINNDHGSENNKDFASYLKDTNVLQFYSRPGTPTDNPRVERSHLTDEVEFYSRANIYNTFDNQREALKEWEHNYNFKRPHQALGYLTPMAFYRLWKKNPEEAHRIMDKWQIYLKKQRIRLAQSRKFKKKEQIEVLMTFIDSKLEQKTSLNEAKLQLINCQLCSVA
jgi:hypothetical protein